MGRILVIDTSYLLELYKVPGFYEDAAHREVRARFGRAVQEGWLLFVPLPCVLEVANHIADCHAGPRRVELMQRFIDDIQTSRAEAKPWVVTPANMEVLEQLVESLPDELARTGRKQKGFGLTDAYTAHEADRLKVQEKERGTNRCVHIWTRDNPLKSREPDSEPDPFV